MADGVQITAGSGTTILTDDTGAGGHAQVVKLGISTDGSATLIPADATNGISTKVTNSSLPIGDGTNVIAIDTTPGDGEANNVNCLHVEGRNYLYNGTTWDRVRGDTTNGLDVDVTRVSGNVTVVQSTASNLNANVSGTVTANAGTGSFTVAQATASNLNAQVVGTIAHGSADSGNPQKVGTRARSTVITSVSSDQRTDAIGTIQGYVVTYPYALPQSSLTGTASATGTSDTAVIAAQGAGITINVTTITVYNDSTTNTFVNIKDGATTRLVIPAPAKGGAMVTLPSPLRLTANTALNFASGSAVTTMYVSAVGFAGI